MKIFARVNGEDFAVNPLPAAEFAEVVRDFADPTHWLPAWYNVDDPQQVWPLPAKHVEIIRLAD